MSFRTRIYETTYLGKGKRMVTSGSVSDYWFKGLFGLLFKLFVIWPIKICIVWPAKLLWYLFLWCLKILVALIKLLFKKIFGK